MEIHELDTGTLQSTDYVAVDDGSNTRKVDFGSIISTLSGKTTSYMLTATVSNQSFTAGEMRAIQFTFTVPTGYRIVAMSDASNWAYLIGAPISWGIGDGQVTAYLNYYANTALNNKNLTARAYAVKV